MESIKNFLENAKKKKKILLLAALVPLAGFFAWSSFSGKDLAGMAGGFWKNGREEVWKPQIKTDAAPETEAAREKTVESSEPLPPTKADSVLSFNSSELAVSAGRDFSLEAQIDPGANRVSAVELRVTFDPQKLRLDKVEEAEKFPLELQAPQIDNEKGAASLALAVGLDRPSVSEKTAVAIFRFHALSQGETEVVFAESSVAAADGEAGNVIKARDGIRIRIGE